MEQVYESLTYSDDRNKVKHKMIKRRLSKLDAQLEAAPRFQGNDGLIVDLSALSPPLTDEDCDTLAATLLNCDQYLLAKIEGWLLCRNRISSRGATKLLVTIRSLGLSHSLNFRDNPFIEFLGCRDRVSASLGLAPCRGRDCPVRMVQSQIISSKRSLQDNAGMKALILDMCPIFSVSTCIVEVIGRIQALYLRHTRFSNRWCLLELLRSVQPCILSLQRLPYRKKQFLDAEASTNLWCSDENNELETSPCGPRLAPVTDNPFDDTQSVSERSFAQENFTRAVSRSSLVSSYPQFFSCRRFVDSSAIEQGRRNFPSRERDSYSVTDLASSSSFTGFALESAEGLSVPSVHSLENLTVSPSNISVPENLSSSRQSSQQQLFNTEENRETNIYSPRELFQTSFSRSMGSVSSSYLRWKKYSALMDDIEEEEEDEGSLLRQTPICDYSCYCEFFIALCPFLQVINEIEIDEEDRKYAQKVLVKHFQVFAYNDGSNLNVLKNLSRRQLGMKNRQVSRDHHSLNYEHETDSSVFTSERKNMYYGHSSQLEKNFLSAFTTSRMTVHCSRICHVPYRARQFEYHPLVPDLMAVGTVDGEVILLNHEKQNLLGSTRINTRENETILALCWLPNYPEKLLIGSDHGTIQLLNISDEKDFQCVRSFENFELQTSLHANCTSQFFLTSGYSTDIGVYDIRTGVKVQTLKECHSEHINVTRFSNLSPFLFATSSFDRSIKLFDIREPPVNGRQMPIFVRSSRMGNVMVCFSPDDTYLLSSAIDNEVYQYTVSDGRLHTHFPIPKTRSIYNYTRSYYMNGKDYMITGSCEEKVVRIYSATSGKLFREVEMNTSLSSEHGSHVNNILSKESPYIQSLRGDPFQPFSFSVLLSHCRLSIPGEIIKVDMLKTFDEQSYEKGLSCRGGA